MSESVSEHRAATFLTGALMPHEFEELQEIQRRNDQAAKPVIVSAVPSERMIKIGYVEWDGVRLTARITNNGREAVRLHRKYQRGDDAESVLQTKSPRIAVQGD